MAGTDLTSTFTQMFTTMIQIQMLSTMVQNMMAALNPNAWAFGSIGSILAQILPILILVKVLDKLG